MCGVREKVMIDIGLAQCRQAHLRLLSSQGRLVSQLHSSVYHHQSHKYQKAGDDGKGRRGYAAIQHFRSSDRLMNKNGGGGGGTDPKWLLYLKVASRMSDRDHWYAVKHAKSSRLLKTWPEGGRIAHTVVRGQ